MSDDGRCVVVRGYCYRDLSLLMMADRYLKHLSFTKRAPGNEDVSSFAIIRYMARKIIEDCVLSGEGKQGHVRKFSKWNLPWIGIGASFWHLGATYLSEMHHLVGSTQKLALWVTDYSAQAVNVQCGGPIPEPNIDLYKNEALRMLSRMPASVSRDDFVRQVAPSLTVNLTEGHQYIVPRVVLDSKTIHEVYRSDADVVTTAGGPLLVDLLPGATMDVARWWDIWGAATALFNKCVQHGLYGTCSNLGEP